jgi:hypothetical protein
MGKPPQVGICIETCSLGIAITGTTLRPPPKRSFEHIEILAARSCEHVGEIRLGVAVPAGRSSQLTPLQLTSEPARHLSKLEPIEDAQGLRRVLQGSQRIHAQHRGLDEQTSVRVVGSVFVKGRKRRSWIGLGTQGANGCRQ